jgi:hypothetical protein
MTDLRGHIAEAAAAKGLSIGTLERYADEIGVPKDGRADEAQLAQILARIYSPGRGVPTAAPALEQPSATDGDGAAPVARGGESSESPPPTAGSEGAVSPSLPSGPALDPQALLESAQAIVGGEIVDVHLEGEFRHDESVAALDADFKPLPFTVDTVPPELQARIERARAKGKAKEEPETLAEQLRVEA